MMFTCFSHFIMSVTASSKSTGAEIFRAQYSAPTSWPDTLFPVIQEYIVTELSRRAITPALGKECWKCVLKYSEASSTNGQWLAKPEDFILRANMPSAVSRAESASISL